MLIQWLKNGNALGSSESFTAAPATPVIRNAVASFALGTSTVRVVVTDGYSIADCQFPVEVTELLQYDFGGFVAPVDAPPTINTGKAGKTYPVKFQLSDHGAAVTDLAAVSSLTYQATSCSAFGNASRHALIEASATGGTSLRYDSTTNTFVYNWKSPSAAGATPCGSV